MLSFNKFQVSVKDLVGFFYFEGSLTSSFQGKDRALIGTNIHKKLQASRPACYEKEVSLKKEYLFDDYALTIQGRADGVYQPTDNHEYIIEEIKSTTKDLTKLEQNPNREHLAQLKVYGYFLAESHNLKTVQLDLTYYNIINNEIKVISNDFTFKELEEFFKGLFHRYNSWISTLAQENIERTKSLISMSFPYPSMRKGQRDMATAIYKSIENNAAIRIQAPTGIGKTVGSIFPALKALGYEQIERIFYFTNKGTIANIAEQTCRTMLDNGCKFRSVFLTAKRKICFNTDKACDPEDCLFARDYFTKFDNIRYKLLKNSLYTKDLIVEIAQKYELCPYELSLDIANISDFIVGDCNYFFDLKARLKRFFEVVTEKYVFLFDEAHNLHERVRDSYSAEFSRDYILEIKRETKTSPSNIKSIINSINKKFLEIEKQAELGYQIIDSFSDTLLMLCKKYINAMNTLLQSGRIFENRKQLLDFYFYINDFMRTYDLEGDNYLYYQYKKRRLTYKIYCLDPAPIIKHLLRDIKSTIFFSATLTPVDYFEYLLAVSKKENYYLELNSHYPKENLIVLLDKNIDTTYKKRDDYYELIAQRIKEITEEYSGNFLVFFPSYAFMSKVTEIMGDPIPNMVIQKRNLNADDREELLKRFSRESIVLMAVSGSFFSEGIDLPGDQLKGVIIVGVSLPMVSFERDLIKKYYDSIDKNGFDYAYKYPALIKVIQAGGRLIRSESDTGLLALLDKRFSYSNYYKHLPLNWQSQKFITDTNSIKDLINKK